VTDPAKYYGNNVSATITLLTAMKDAGCRRIVFSSTCATYGEPERIPIPEDHPQRPINPYGRSKWMVEQILRDFDHAYGMKHLAFRYFNAAGAHPDADIGELHEPETHLIPLVFRAIESGKPIQIFGTDYPTRDGTCIRDYIHVVDLARAHLLGMERLLAGGSSGAYNLGNGSGYSVREVIETAERVTGRKVPSITAPRRAGDPAELIGTSAAAIRDLGWKPSYAKLDQIVETAWRFHTRKAH
jgi:UDP-glucose-4-epimerase GalE